MKWFCKRVKKSSREYIISNEDIKEMFSGYISVKIPFKCNLEDDYYFIEIHNINNLTNISITRKIKKIMVLKEEPCKINSNNNICCVCTELITKNDVVRPNVCNHLYHKKCLEKAFTYNEYCPICRATVNDSH